MPGAKRRYEEENRLAEEQYYKDVAAQQSRLADYQRSLQARRAAYDQHVAEVQRQAAEQHAEIDTFTGGFIASDPGAIVEYFTLVLQRSPFPDGFLQQAKVAYIAESRQLVVEYDFPLLDVAPEVSAYRYIKAKNEIASTPRPAAQRKSLYTSIIAQITLRCLYELFTADRPRHLEVLVFNGHVSTIDPATGRPIHPCLVTVRTTRELFEQLDLSRVEPAACLKSLSASVSRSPTELAPVRPVLDFDMVDPRFIEKTDVLSGLDHRQNLMDLSPSEFEALIANLFQAMGLETRLTQASRDGGVDCVAYDPRPILGGKVVIQAKRYKHTVGVSAVRDLYGTMQNEGATKGILVTTSGYGKAAYEFANGKPLELLSGQNLLALLADHAGIEAKIVMPEQWVDPGMDIADNL